ncbi:hypothetical protein [Microbispora sp. H10670]|uniref:hypothetical protein n=1 Tax=Microbispora sp. H10670 TaxID=2729108 RepID=UPI0016004C3C|nr:hypothetical protein [Microbispora sp. H10670]
MASPAHDGPHHLVDRLPAHQARRLLRLVETDPELSSYIPGAPKPGRETTDDEEAPVPAREARRRILFAGILDDGPADLAERAEDYLHEHFTSRA